MVTKNLATRLGSARARIVAWRAIEKSMRKLGAVIGISLAAIMTMGQGVAAPEVQALKNLTVACVAANPAVAIDQTGYNGSLICWNMSATPVYLGGSNVTTTNGLPLCNDPAVCPMNSWPPDVASKVVYIDCAINTTIYCIAGSVSTGN